MKILHVNYHQNQGGASVSVDRIFNSLKKNKIKSKLLVNEKTKENKFVIDQFDNFIEKFFHKIKKLLAIYIKKLLGANNCYKDSISVFKSNLHKKINKIDADIINLHWICNEMISIEEIKKINKPIVWTIVDMWPFSGSSHYTKNNFYQFTNKKFNKKKKFNIENWVLKRKIKNFHNKIVIICISKWLTKLAKKSFVFKNNIIHTIPCTIDINFWKKLNKNNEKKNLGLDPKKKYFLFSSFNGISDERKGFDLMLKALTKIKLDKNNYEILILGNAQNIDEMNKNYKFNFKIFDNKFDKKKLLLKKIYSACDILIMPSRLEAFGQVALEAGSCSLPTVSFRNTGVEDIIDHKKNGYLAKYLDINDLARGIDMLSIKRNNIIMSKNIRKKVCNNFSYKIIAKKYRDVYEKIKKN